MYNKFKEFLRGLFMDNIEEQELGEAIKKHLQKYAKSDKCQICYSSKWIVLNSQLATLNLEKKTVDTGKCFPCFAVICSNCSYILFFSSNSIDKFLIKK